MIEFGFVLEPSPLYTARLAARLEALGFDAVLCPDTQNLCAEPYGQLALAAAATRRIRIGTGVTNPVTRAAAVTASAMAALQIESGGRALLGIGRGDSSAAHIGRRNATTEELRTYCTRVRAYLRGETVQEGDAPSRLRWIDAPALAPLPIDVACTGPRTIRMAADVADRVSFAVGAAPERIAWALRELDARLAESGRSRADVRVGAYVIVVCLPDEKRAIALARMMSGLIAHFTALRGAPLEHLPPRLKALAARLQSGYDMQNHNLSQGSHVASIDDEFVDWFAICGPRSKCLDRLGELLELGLDHVHVLGGAPEIAAHGPRWEATVDLQEEFAADVMPALRKGR